jgi:hypothetical protein
MRLSITREQLFEYLIDCLGFDNDTIVEWSKQSTQYIAKNWLTEEQWMDCLKFNGK